MSETRLSLLHKVQMPRGLSLSICCITIQLGYHPLRNLATIADLLVSNVLLQDLCQVKKSYLGQKYLADSHIYLPGQ